MHTKYSSRGFWDNAGIVVLAESQEVVLNSKTSKNDGYGGLVAVGLILFAVAVTILVFYRNRRRNTSDIRQSDDHQQDELGEPDDHDLKMK
jgi:hypothetical protein